MFLSDGQLLTLLEAPKPIITGLDLGPPNERYAKNSPVQPASVDLTIGSIYDPGAEPGKLGSADQPRSELILKSGQTAVITTTETCKFPASIGAFGFPPNEVSSKGILMTNPGHVDPGYEGRMTFTVINMGQEDYGLQAGGNIVTLLLFWLDHPAQRPLDTRREVASAGSNIPELLARLSPDFLDVSRRAHKAARSEEKLTRIIGLLAPIVISALTLGLSILYFQESTDTEVSDLKARVSNADHLNEIETRVKSLEQQADSKGPGTP
jgi:dCTP deaminase